jgi:hypothetical protein
VAITARNQTRGFARKRVCANYPCAARTVLDQRLRLAETVDLEFCRLALRATS